jgi:hypothetical protein
MNARFQFNTGRLYTQEGQVIVATNDGAAILCNEFTCDLTGTGLADHVMRCYDRGNYRGISSSEAPQLDRAAPVVHVY